MEQRITTIADIADGSVEGFRHVGRAESNLDYWDGE